MVKSQTLWNFAVAFYAQPQVADTCLRLQDEYKANVCLLIALRWLDTCDQALSDEEFVALKTHVAAWTAQIVEPLRQLRRQLKSPFEPYQQDETQEQLRNAVKQAELLAEKKLLEEIEHWMSKNVQASKANASSNIEDYIVELNAPKELLVVLCK
ncbi:TIGR02444 family protein [Cellvibrio zantedeschiae]|nr:TIGR02444 family protein [Cellvibrio zantedeschiae]